MPYAYRNKGLANWGFNCTCSMCTASVLERDESDRRRERLVEIYNSMNDEETSYDKLVELTKEFVGIVAKEGLIPKVGEYYQIFMRIYYGYGDTESAYKYAKTALKYAETFADPEGGFCTGLRADLHLLERELEADRSKDK